MSSVRGHLPRLKREFYRGFAAVHWTFCLRDRATGWLDEGLHARFRELMVHACSRYGCVCATYCLMPDHLHLLLVGTREEADLYLAARFLRKHLEPALKIGAFQKQGHDHVLRVEERKKDAFAKVCHYILENPVRADCAVRRRSTASVGA
jgi:REP element-mobilizing transposase RayT